MLCYDDTEEAAIAPLLCSVLSCTFHLQCRQLRIVVGYSKQRSSLHGHVVCCVVVVAVYCGRRVLWSPCIMVAVYYGRRVLQLVTDTHVMCHPSIHPSIHQVQPHQHCDGGAVGRDADRNVCRRGNVLQHNGLLDAPGSPLRADAGAQKRKTAVVSLLNFHMRNGMRNSTASVSQDGLGIKHKKN
jgi:hypothetical protein